MKSIELEALGLIHEQIRAVQKIHGADLERERNRPDAKTRQILEALVGIARLISSEGLNELLLHAQALYIKQNPSQHSPQT